MGSRKERKNYFGWLEDVGGLLLVPVICKTGFEN